MAEQAGVYSIECTATVELLGEEKGHVEVVVAILIDEGKLSLAVKHLSQAATDAAYSQLGTVAYAVEALGLKRHVGQYWIKRFHKYDVNMHHVLVEWLPVLCPDDDIPEERARHSDIEVDGLSFTMGCGTKVRVVRYPRTWESWQTLGFGWEELERLVTDVKPAAGLSSRSTSSRAAAAAPAPAAAVASSSGDDLWDANTFNEEGPDDDGTATVVGSPSATSEDAESGAPAQAEAPLWVLPVVSFVPSFDDLDDLDDLDDGLPLPLPLPPPLPPPLPLLPRNPPVLAPPPTGVLVRFAKLGGGAAQPMTQLQGQGHGAGEISLGPGQQTMPLPYLTRPPAGSGAPHHTLVLPPAHLRAEFPPDERGRKAFKRRVDKIKALKARGGPADQRHEVRPRQTWVVCVYCVVCRRAHSFAACSSTSHVATPTPRRPTAPSHCSTTTRRSSPCAAWVPAPRARRHARMRRCQ